MLINCRYGIFAIPHSSDLIYNSLLVYGEWAQNELNVLCEFIKEGDTIFDVGAFIGTHTRAFSQIVGETGAVLAFEPNKASYQLLVENIAYSDIKNIKSLNIGLASKIQTMYVSNHDATNQGANTLENIIDINLQGISEVEIKTLDCFVDTIEHVDFIKLDVEGMEADIITGGKKIINKHEPVIFLEVNNLENIYDIVEWAKKEKYIIYGLISTAFNRENYNHINDNIFLNAKEIGLLLFSNKKHEIYFEKIQNMKLPLVCSIDDLVLLLLNKPQYFFEILLKTSVANVLGIRFLSEAQIPYLLEQEDSQHYEERKRKLNEVVLCVDDLQEQTSKLAQLLELKNQEVVKLQEQTSKLAQLLELKNQEVVKLQEFKEQLLIEKHNLIIESSKNENTILELEKNQSVFENNVLEIWNNLQNFK